MALHPLGQGSKLQRVCSMMIHAGGCYKRQSADC